MSLSDRIAALNSRSSNSSHPTSPKAPLRAGASVKDKAAQFSALGVAPAPKGSFASGLPAATLGPKRNNELYGNRILSASGGSQRASSPYLTPSSGSRSGSHSRASSVASVADDRPPSRTEEPPSPNPLATSTSHPDPLTTEAVESLGAATFDDPAGGDRAFHSVAASEIDINDATSSVAVEVDDVDPPIPDATDDLQTPVGNDDGRASPALSHSTVSDSAMREAPPLLTPASSSLLINTLSSSGSQDVMSRAATQGASSVGQDSGSVSTVPPEGQRVQTPDGDGIPHLQTSASSVSLDIASMGFPLALSSKLVESLEPSKPVSGGDTPRSVVVEVSTVDQRSEAADDGQPVLFVEGDENPKIYEAGEGPSGEPIEVDLASDDGRVPVQPNLELSAPVLPLSSAHLRSLDVPSSSGGSRSGYDTPHSTAVEDGSVDGRTLAELDQDMVLNIDQEYIDSDGPNEMDSIAPSPSVLTPDDPNLAPGPSSPAELAYDPTAMVLTPRNSLSAHDPDTLASIGELASIPPAIHIDLPPPAKEHSPEPESSKELVTPMASRIALPTMTPMTSSSGDRAGISNESKEGHAQKSQEEALEVGGIDSDFPLPKFSVSHDIDEEAGQQVPEEYAPLQDSPTLPPAYIEPIAIPRTRDALVTNTDQSLCSTPSTARPASGKDFNTLGMANTLPVVSCPVVIPSITLDKPGPSPISATSPSITEHPSLGSSPTTRAPPVTAASPTITRRRSTHLATSSDSSTLAPPSASASATIRRTASSSKLSQTPKKKKNRLMPGEWITDDDVYDDDAEPGWASIIVSRLLTRHS